MRNYLVASTNAELPVFCNFEKVRQRFVIQWEIKQRLVIQWEMKKFWVNQWEMIQCCCTVKKVWWILAACD